jgi:hypothetical protein
VDAESSAEEDGGDKSLDSDLSTVTNLSETRRQVDEELGNAALNLSGTSKNHEGKTRL